MWSKRSLCRCPGHSGLPTALTEVEAAGRGPGGLPARQAVVREVEGGRHMPNGRPQHLCFGSHSDLHDERPHWQ